MMIQIGLEASQDDVLEQLAETGGERDGAEVLEGNRFTGFGDERDTCMGPGGRKSTSLPMRIEKVSKGFEGGGI